MISTTRVSTTLRTTLITVGLATLLAGCPAQKESGIQPLSNPTISDTEHDDSVVSSTAPVFPEEAFRDKQPAGGQPRDFNLPGITEFKLGKQIDVFLVERHELPTISIELNFDGGTVSDRLGREGTASVCMSMVSEGTKKLDKLAFEEAQANIASGISSYAGTETQGVSMYTLSKNFEATFSLFSDTIREPGLRSAELSRMIKRRVESLKQSKGSPGSIAGRIANSIMVGQKHPFGRITTEQSLGKIKLSDCKRYHKSYVRPNGARLFIVGDMTQAQVVAAFTPLLTSWKGSPRKLAKLPAPKSRAGRVFFVDVPGAAQSSIYLGHMGPGRSDASYFANQMMAGVLGGGFSSRINMNLREAKGYTYGARGNFTYNRHFGFFLASSSVRSDATHQSIKELFSEMAALKSGVRPALAQELDREKNGAILGLPARFSTARQVLSMYRTLVYYGLPMSYYNDYVGNYSKVTLEQVNAAAATLLHPEDALVLVVGDGSATQIKRDDEGNDVATQQTLLDTLAEVAKSELGGAGSLVILDADGNVKH